MMKSLYGAYIKEREDFDIVENEFGFATFQINGDSCYIRDIYVVPAMRNREVASELADQIAKIAKENGCIRLTGSVCPQAKGATASLCVLLGYGFKLMASRENFVLFEKEII